MRLSYKTMGISLSEEGGKKPLSFSNLLPKLCHPNTNKGHVIAAERHQLPGTRGPGGPLPPSTAAPREPCHTPTSERAQTPSLLCPEVTQAGAACCPAQLDLQELLPRSSLNVSSSPNGDPWPGGTWTRASSPHPWHGMLQVEKQRGPCLVFSTD